MYGGWIFEKKKKEKGEKEEREKKEKREEEGGRNEFGLRIFITFYTTDKISDIPEGDFFTFLARYVLFCSGKQKKNTTMRYETGGNWEDLRVRRCSDRNS